MLRETVSELFQELNTQFKQSNNLVNADRAAVGKAQSNLQRAKEQEEHAICEDELINTKQKELIDYCNGLLEKPQAFLDKIQNLGEEHEKVFRKCREAKTIVQQ